MSIFNSETEIDHVIIIKNLITIQDIMINSEAEIEANLEIDNKVILAKYINENLWKKLPLKSFKKIIIDKKIELQNILYWEFMKSAVFYAHSEIAL